MKTILKKLNFNEQFTRHDLIERLTNGEDFMYIDPLKPNRQYLHYDKNHTVSPFRLDTNAWDWRGLKYLHELIEQPWHEDPEAKGVVCHFWDHESDKERLHYGAFIGMAGDEFISSNGRAYTNALPLTEDNFYKGGV